MHLSQKVMVVLKNYFIVGEPRAIENADEVTLGQLVCYKTNMHYLFKNFVIFLLQSHKISVRRYIKI